MKDNIIIDDLKNMLTHYKYKKLNEYLSEAGEFKLEGIFDKNDVFGTKQNEGYWFKYVYINQTCGICGDDYEGTLFIPLDNEDKKFLKIYYWC